MLVSGLWHGTGLNYLVWGFYHGLLIAILQLSTKTGKSPTQSAFNIFLSWLVTTILILFGWTLFRANSLAWLGTVLFSSPFINDAMSVNLASFSYVLFYSGLYLVEFIVHRSTGKTTWARSAFYASITILILFHSNSISPDFIYTHF